MIADGLIKALTLVNNKVFVEIIDLEDQRERPTSIKLEKNQRDIFLLRKVKQKSEVIRYRVNIS